MSSGANVQSIDAIRDFRAALNTFTHEAREALDSFGSEVNRSLDWLLSGAPSAWQNEYRKTEQRLGQAKIELQNCRSRSLADGSPPACLEEKKQLERARQRMQYVEEKIVIVRQVGQAADREVTDYKGRANQLASLLDGELPRAVALLDRALSILESYVNLSHPTGALTAEEAAGARQIAGFSQPAAAESPSSAQEDAGGLPPAVTAARREDAPGTDPAHTTDSGSSAGET